MTCNVSATATAPITMPRSYIPWYMPSGKTAKSASMEQGIVQLNVCRRPTPAQLAP